jgi:antirestriction protein ArdC
MKKTKGTTKSKSTSKTVYGIVTEQILEQLRKGVAPWLKPWKPGQSPRRWVVNEPYRGVNLLLLEQGGEYATFKQIKEAGGEIKPEEMKNYSYSVFHSKVTGSKKNKDEDEEESEGGGSYWVLKYYRVWEINKQCTGLASKREIEPVTEPVNVLIDPAEDLIKNFADAPPIRFKSGRAFYSPGQDFVSVPPKEDFYMIEEYYKTLFHELVHSTGHPKRIGREFGKKFGDELYSKEELIAEMGAAMLCGVAGLEHTIETSASYLSSWINALEGDERLIVNAASGAQKAAEYIQGTPYKYEATA